MIPISCVLACPRSYWMNVSGNWKLFRKLSVFFYLLFNVIHAQLDRVIINRNNNCFGIFTSCRRIEQIKLIGWWGVGMPFEFLRLNCSSLLKKNPSHFIQNGHQYPASILWETNQTQHLDVVASLVALNVSYPSVIEVDDCVLYIYSKQETLWLTPAIYAINWNCVDFGYSIFKMLFR